MKKIPSAAEAISMRKNREIYSDNRQLLNLTCKTNGYEHMQCVWNPRLFVCVAMLPAHTGSSNVCVKRIQFLAFCKTMSSVFKWKKRLACRPTISNETATFSLALQTTLFSSLKIYRFVMVGRRRRCRRRCFYFECRHPISTPSLVDRQLS